MSNMRPGERFFEARKPPNVPMFSQDNIDWYAEQKRRCFEGYSYRGTRFTGDQWWFYNMCPMPIVKVDKKTGKENFTAGWAYWSQEDDYRFKQFEEAEQSKLGVGFFTGRGYGKTQIILSIAGKIFYLKDTVDEETGLSRPVHCVVSASSDDHANPTFMKFGNLINYVNHAHPSIAVNLLKNNDEIIVSGDETFKDGSWVSKDDAIMEKIVYGTLAGKSKGRRLDFQAFEEAGDWAENASLKECIEASRGTWNIGSIKVCREFYIGTGGTVRSAQAKEIALNPEAYGIYPVVEHGNRKTIIVVPAFKKFGGFWEETGFSDEEGAKAFMQKQRELKKMDTDPTAYNKYVQEYPFTFDEMFQLAGGNRFDKEKLANNLTTLEMFPEKRQGKWGDLIWRKKDGVTVGVDFMENANGKIWLLEEPKINPETGKAWKRLYVGGYDGIDVGADQSVAGASSGSIAVKKRFAPGMGIHDVYTCFYTDRPRDIYELFENVHKICVYFNLVEALNIEDTKRGIVAYLRDRGGYHFLMPRPRITLGNAVGENTSSLVGTTATPKNFEYGENYLIQHIKDYGDQLVHIPALRDLIDFTMDTRGQHDITVSMMMCEIADGEFFDKPVMKPKPPPPEEESCYYTDSQGRKRWGKKSEARRHGAVFAGDTWLN